MKERLGHAFLTIVRPIAALEWTFGKELTTRTWDTVAKVTRAGG